MRWILGVGLVTLVVGCSIGSEKCTNVNQDSIFQSYSVSYQADDDKTTADATLRFAQFGTTLEMDGNCSITHSDYGLSESGLLGTSYSGSGAGFLADHEFVFTDNASKTFRNSGTLRSIALNNPPGTVTRASGVTQAWTGSAVGAKESVSLYLSAQNGSGATVAASATTNNEGATQVTLNGADMEGLVNGPAELYLVRSASPGLTETSSAGGEFFLYYTSERFAVTLQD